MRKGLLIVASLLLIAGCTFGTNPVTNKPTIKTDCAVCKLVWTGVGFEYVCPTTQPTTQAVQP